MRTKNLTPFLFGAMVTSLRPPRPAATLIVKGSFRLRPGAPVEPLTGPLEQGTLSGDVFAADDDERRGALLYASDFADYKLRVDLLLRGRCHTPGNKPLPECPVRFSVGGFSRTLRVVGPRVWVRSVLGDVPSDPAPFTTLPIDYAHAFGGPSYPDNPAGRGVGTEALHHLEAPGEVVRGREDRVAPACFGPLSPFWPQRRARVGKEYGAAYQQTRAPFYAEDFDWSFFQSAPPEQQVDSLRGDEEMSFVNLHPEAPSFSARLPGLRIRAFLHDDRQRFREVGMRLDTLLADLEDERLVLTWRGVEDVREDDLADVKTVLIASEPLGAAPEDVARYRDELLAFEADPLGLSARRAEIMGPFAAAEDEEEDQPRPFEDPAWAAMREKTRGMPAEDRAKLRRLFARMGTLPVRGEDPRRAVAAALERPPEPRPPMAFPRKPGSLPYVPLGREIQSIRGASARAQGTLAREDVQKATAGREVDLSFFEEMRELEENVFLRQLDPYSFRPEGRGADAPGPGADLSGRDLSGHDLGGADLAGANLEGAILLKANLEGANLRGARLKHAILHEARLAGADLSGADLTLANLGRAEAQRAVLRGALLDQTHLEKANLSEADLSEARGEYTVFSSADLTSATARSARLEKAFFEASTLAGADFTGATLSGCRFLGAKAPGAAFAGALLDRSSFAEADLTGARFAAARGERVLFLNANLARADLGGTVLPDAFFDEADAREARFPAASLRRARLYRASLAGAVFEGADLLDADLRKADLTGASFRQASLFGARLRLARRQDCDFSGANMQQAIADGRSPARER